MLEDGCRLVCWAFSHFDLPHVVMVTSLTGCSEGQLPCTHHCHMVSGFQRKIGDDILIGRLERQCQARTAATWCHIYRGIAADIIFNIGVRLLKRGDCQAFTTISHASLPLSGLPPSPFVAIQLSSGCNFN